MPEHLDHELFHLVGDDVLPAVRFGIGLVPGQADQVGQQPFGQAVLADDACRPFPAGVGEGQGVPVELDEPGVAQAVHHLGDRGSGMPDPFGQARLYYRGPFVHQIGDGLDVLLGGRMDARVVGGMYNRAVAA